MTTTAFTHIANVALPTKLINAIKVFDKINGEKNVVKVANKSGTLTFSVKADNDYITWDIQSDNQVDFEFAVDYSLFVNYIKGAESMLVHFGNKNVTINGNTLDFISVIDTHKEHNFQCSVTFGSDILTAIKKVGGCIKKDSANILSNIYVKAFSSTFSEVVATDGYSLGKVKLYSKDIEGFTGYTEFLLSRKVISFLNNFLKGSFEVTLRGFDGKISVVAESFEFGKFIFETDYTDGVYPDYDRIIKDSLREEKMVLCRKALKTQLKEHIQFHKENKVGKYPVANFSFDDNGDIKITSQLLSGAKFVTTIYNLNSGKSINKSCFNVNIKYLKSVVDSLEGSSVISNFNCSSFNCIIFNQQSDKEIFLLMPIRSV